MTVREYAKSVGFEVVGKLKRLPDDHLKENPTMRAADYRVWVDEAGNWYGYRYDSHKGFCVCPADSSDVL